MEKELYFFSLSQAYLAAGFGVGILFMAILPLSYYFRNIEKFLLKINPLAIHFGKYKIKGEVRCHNQPVNQSVRVKLTNLDTNRRTWFATNRRGEFNLFLKANRYTLKIDEFGLKQKNDVEFEIDEKNIPTRLILQAKVKEEIVVDPLSSELIFRFRIIWLILGLAGVAILIFGAKYLNYQPKMILFTCVLIFFYLAAQSRTIFFKIIDFRGKPIKSNSIKILNSRGQILKKTKTNQSGYLSVFASKGFYKIETNSTIARTFRVDEDSIINIVLKV